LGTVLTSTNYQLDPTTVVPPHQTHLANHTAIVDTGATGHYLDQSAAQHCTNVHHTDDGPSVQVANGQNIETTTRAIVPLAPELSNHAKIGHIFQGLKSGSLISIGQLCDDDCVALFTKFNVKLYKNGKVIIIGKRNATNGLWNIPLAPKPAPSNTPNAPAAPQYQHTANGAIRDLGTKQALASFLHACAFSPIPSTFLRAIQRGHFKSWPGLTPSLITKHLSKSLATSKGHLRMQQKNIRSTKPLTADLPIATSLDFSPSQDLHNPRTHIVFPTIINTTNLQKSYSDQTGKFPIQSSRGHNYVMILYDYDSNAILSIPLKTRQASELTQAWTTLHTKLQHNGYAPTLHILDNECSDDLKKAFRKYDVDFQRVPPHSHRRNAAEQAIQTWKNHFCSGLATCDPKFPLTEWDLLMPQADLTLNLLRSSLCQPNLSAYDCLNGIFDFNRSPLAPPGTRVVVHITPNQRQNMAPHGIDGWYVGPSTEHYRCHKCYIPSTFRVRDALTIDWFPHAVPFPKVSTDDYLRQTATDMLTLIQGKSAQPSPSLTFGSNLRNAYIQIAQILKRATAPPVTPAPDPIAPTPTAREQRVPPVKPPAPQQRVLPSAPTPTAARLAPAKIIPCRPARRSPRLLSQPRLLRSHTAPLAQSAISHRYAHHIAALTITPPTSGKQGSLKTLLRGPDEHIWTRGLANEWGRLLEHGLGQQRSPADRIAGTGTLFFISRTQVPKGRTATYANFVCSIRPQKTETHRVRMTAGGDKLDYPGDASSPTVSMLDAKIHINSIISDAKTGARHLSLDIKNYFLGTPMAYFQYLRVPPSAIPKEVWDDTRYTITVADDGFVYLEIRRGMYGLKEAAIIAFNQLVRKLAPSGYEPMPFTPGLWRHRTKRTTFVLCVDDFGVKYFSKADALHLIHAIQAHYELTTDWTGSLYCGLTLHWNYAKGYVDVSMPDYVPSALAKFKHPAPSSPQHAPHKWVEPAYGSRQPQAPTLASTAPLLDKHGITRIQSINGTFLYYGRACDPCILPALNELASAQASPTTDTRAKAHMLMDYLHTYPNAIIRYYASDMILKITSDAAYLVQPKARSRAAVHYHLGWHRNDRTNGALDVLCQTIKNVVSSAAEAETGGIYLGGKHACPIRAMLHELGHAQPSAGSPFETDNNTAQGILNSKMRRKLSKAFDMRYWWMKDRIHQRQFNLTWAPGKFNLADYFTKHHPPWHHRKMRSKYLQKAIQYAQHAAQRQCARVC
jgi:hypothetical protein